MIRDHNEPPAAANDNDLRPRPDDDPAPRFPDFADLAPLMEKCARGVKKRAEAAAGLPPPSGKRSSAAGTEAGTATLIALPTSADKQGITLRALMEEVRELAEESLAAAKQNAGDQEIQQEYIKQGVTLVNCYAKLVTTLDRHEEVIRKRLCAE